MQTTLLGFAIAVILALLAALIGPYFVDWNQFRPQFEAEASRLIGAPVRVRDALDARLLPTPTLRLKAVSIGKEGDASRMRADRLDVEFSLGSLMRGEWRASELTLDGVTVDLAVDEHGRIGWTGSSGANLGALAIDRLRLNGRIAVHDAASRETLAFDDLAFAGDVRALAGAARGDGEFRFGDVRYPFRLQTSRSADGVGTRMHFAIDPGTRPIGLDLDGVVRVEAMVPHFDGAVTLTRAVTLRGGDRTPGLTTPWKLSARVKADPAAAKFEQLDAVYGTDEVGLKLSGSAAIAFGAAPSLQATLSARQLDADRLLARESTTTEPTRLIPGLRGLVAALPPPPFAARVSLGADAVTLGGRPLQNIALDAHSEGEDWVVDRFDGRLPGATQLSIGGRLMPHPKAHFAGAVKLEASDPDQLSVWLRGEGEPSLRSQKPLRLTGVLSVAPDRIALDDVDADIDGSAVTGRIALSDVAATAADPSHGGLRLEAAVNGERLDLDGLTGLVRSFAGPRASWPDEAAVSLDLGHGRLGGAELAPFVARFGYGHGSATLTKLTVGAAGGVMLDGSGAIDRAANSGRLVVNAGAPALPALTQLVMPLLPEALATRLAALPADGAAKVKLALNLDKATEADRVNGLATADIESAHLKATLHGSMTPLTTALRAWDVDALRRSEVSLDARISADRGPVLLGLLGLDRFVAAGDGAVQGEGTARGSWGAPMSFKTNLSGANLDATAQGSLTLAAVAGGPDDITGTVALVARKLDLSPFFDVTPGKLPVIALSSQIGFAGHDVSINDVDSTVAGVRLRGHLAVKRSDATEFHGELGADRLDLAAALAMATGAIGRGLDEPLGRGVCGGARGAIALQTPRGILPGGLEIKPLSGNLRCDGASLAFDAKGSLGGGEVAGEITAQSGTDGLAVDARAQLSGVDGAALGWRGLPAPGGKTSLQFTASGRGRTAGVIAGALSGGGTVSIEQAKVGGLDPQAFEAAVAASDAGKVSGEASLRGLVAAALKGASLSVATAQIPFSLRDGGLRVPPTTLNGDGARLVVSGGYDITADQFDLRAELASTRVGTATDRPAIEIFAHGPPDRLNTSLDVGLFSSWLAVRAIDRETRRLESIERGEVPAQVPPPATAAIPAPAAPVEAPTPDVSAPPRDARRAAPRLRPAPPAPVAPPPPQASATPPAGLLPPLPPPIDVRPAPGAARPRPPRPPLALTPVPN